MEEEHAVELLPVEAEDLTQPLVIDDAAVEDPPAVFELSDVMLEHQFVDSVNDQTLVLPSLIPASPAPAGDAVVDVFPSEVRAPVAPAAEAAAAFVEEDVLAYVELLDPMYNAICTYIRRNRILEHMFLDVVALSRWKLEAYAHQGPRTILPAVQRRVQLSIEQNDTQQFSSLENLHLGLIAVLNEHHNMQLPIRGVFLMGSKRSIGSLKDGKLRDRLRKVYEH